MVVVSVITTAGFLFAANRILLNYDLFEHGSRIRACETQVGYQQKNKQEGGTQHLIFLRWQVGLRVLRAKFINTVQQAGAVFAFGEVKITQAYAYGGYHQ
jgi:hypothetical protein